MNQGSPRVIAFLTDFGLRDHYVGVMKGVALSICPEAVLVDLTHEVDPQNIAQGAYLLGASFRYFPKGTVFVAVVDPGVGTERRGLCVVAEGRFFVGPDNGLFTLVYDRAQEFVAYELQNQTYFLPQQSTTFHGRDIFAPVAAHLARGLNPSTLGPQVADTVRLPWPQVSLEPGRIRGAVIYVDRFGNLVTNIPQEHLEGKFIKAVCFAGKRLSFKRTYAEVASGEPLALIGSDGLLEIAVSMDSAAKFFGQEGEVLVEFD